VAAPRAAPLGMWMERVLHCAGTRRRSSFAEQLQECNLGYALGCGRLPKERRGMRCASS